MGMKIYFTLFLAVAGLLVLLTRKRPKEFLFWSAMYLLFVRSIGLPGVGTINTSYILLTILFFIDFTNLLNRKNVKQWSLYLLVLVIGFITMLLNSESNSLLTANDLLLDSWLWIKKFLVVILLSITITQYVKTERDIEKLKNAFLWCSFVFSFTATIAYFGFYDGIVIYGAGSLTDGVIQDQSLETIYSEVYGISYSNLVFGITAISIVFLPSINWGKWKKMFFLLITVFAVVISLKRLAIVALALSLIYYLIVEKKNGSNKWVLLIPILLIISTTIYYQLILNRFSGALNSINNSGVTDTSSNIRLNRVDYALKAFSESPIVGKGAGFMSYIHNGFFEVLGNLGIIGLFLFRPFYKVIFKSRLNYFYKNPWSIALIIMLVTLVLLEAAINRVEMMYFLGLFFGGSIVTNKLIQKNK